MQPKKPYVLVIEDNEILGTLIIKTLTSEGYESALCSNGEEGWQSLQKREPDILLLDIVLPEKSGYEILEDMNKVNMLARVPTIIVSNSGEPVQVSRSLALGVRDYIVKADLSVDEVLMKIKKCLSESSSTATMSNEHLKVLMVEDDSFLQTITGKVIGGIFDLRYAADGPTALKEAESFSPDVILLDIVLPGDLSGFGILEHLRADNKNAKTVIIMFTNLGQEDDKKRALALGADDYLVKADFDIGSLERLIRERVAKKRSE
ncbi:MAG: response regulator [bacterium]|nr:response regulator [bacterium]